MVSTTCTTTRGQIDGNISGQIIGLRTNNLSVSLRVLGPRSSAQRSKRLFLELLQLFSYFKWVVRVVSQPSGHRLPLKPPPF